MCAFLIILLTTFLICLVDFGNVNVHAVQTNITKTSMDIKENRSTVGYINLKRKVR